MSNQVPPLLIRAQYLEEPMLEFADGRTRVDPKSGIARFGPKSYSPLHRHPSRVHVGFIGTAETIASAREWLKASAEGVRGDDKHPEFPGCMVDRGFFSQLVFDDDWVAQIYQSELERLLSIRQSRDRFEKTLLFLGGIKE